MYSYLFLLNYYLNNAQKLGEIACEDAVTAVAVSPISIHDRENGTESVMIAYGTEKGYIGVSDVLIER